MPDVVEEEEGRSQLLGIVDVIAIQAFLLMLLSLTGVMPASLWGWVGAREAKYAYQEAQPRPRYHLSCDENGKLAEYEADQMDYHQDIVQLWSE